MEVQTLALGGGVQRVPSVAWEQRRLNHVQLEVFPARLVWKTQQAVQSAQVGFIARFLVLQRQLFRAKPGIIAAVVPVMGHPRRAKPAAHALRDRDAQKEARLRFRVVLGHIKMRRDRANAKTALLVSIARRGRPISLRRRVRPAGTVPETPHMLMSTFALKALSERRHTE